MKTARRKRYEKARNIARNNMEKLQGLRPYITAKNSHIITGAFKRFQRTR